MKTLLLLRHAKAEKGDGRIADRDRPLKEKGREDARRMGAEIVKRGLEPDCILCSPARRTRETLAAVAEAFERSPQPLFADRLYNALPDAILDEIAGAPEDCGCIMVICHNPGLHQLAQGLSDPERAAPGLLSRLAAEFRPGTLAVLDLDVEGWAEVEPRSGALRLLLSPDAL